MDLFGKIHRELHPVEQDRILQLKKCAEKLYMLYPRNSREAALAKTKLQESVMWAVKGLTE